MEYVKKSSERRTIRKGQRNVRYRPDEARSLGELPATIQWGDGLSIINLGGREDWTLSGEIATGFGELPLGQATDYRRGRNSDFTMEEL